jgi:hypothetical protein
MPSWLAAILKDSEKRAILSWLGGEEGDRCLLS